MTTKIVVIGQPIAEWPVTELAEDIYAEFVQFVEDTIKSHLTTYATKYGDLELAVSDSLTKEYGVEDVVIEWAKTEKATWTRFDPEVDAAMADELEDAEHVYGYVYPDNAEILQKCANACKILKKSYDFFVLMHTGDIRRVYASSNETP